MELEYLWLDGSHFKMHPNSGAEPVLCARGITTEGQPVFLHLQAASVESTDSCREFLRDMVARGLRPPLLVTTDGAPGLITTVEQVFGKSLRQRCLVHRTRNVLAKCRADQEEVKADFWGIFDDVEAQPGEPAVAEARRRAAELERKWVDTYPGAVACVMEDLASLTKGRLV